jgi:hypothetical protein
MAYGETSIKTGNLPGTDGKAVLLVMFRRETQADGSDTRRLKWHQAKERLILRGKSVLARVGQDNGSRILP